MPVRIYALAKQMNMDSKALVDVCNQAGIAGKGSALASLTDEEVAKVKEFMASGGKAKAASPAKAAAGAKPAAKPGADASAPIRREDYIAPGGAKGGKVPVLSGKPKPKSPAEKPPEQPKPPAPDEGGAKPPEKAAPSIKLAPVPTAQQPPAKRKESEPAPQKPDIKLPTDVLRASKAGTTPLKEHLRKHEERRKASKTKKTETRPTEEAKPREAPSKPPSRDRGKRPAAADAGDDRLTLGGREQRQLKRKRAAATRHKKPADEEESRTRAPRRAATRIRRTGTNTAAPRKRNAVLQLPCTVRTFSEAVGVSAAQVLGKLLSLGTRGNINMELEAEMAELLAAELGVEIDIRREVDLEDRLLATLEGDEEDTALLKPRPPVVTFLGHVDHGKTSLLDRIIGTHVVDTESGGITQHIRAYRIERDGRAIAFVDTPGHEAFTEMRARGANVTDIAVLVVAADDGVMPQTEEAISHAKAAGVPIVVALNKIDLPGADVQRAYQQLSVAELLPTEWGGDTEMVKTSAATGDGVDELFETLLTYAELHEFQANPDRPAAGTCLEAELHETEGVVAKLLVQKGTLRVGDVVACGAAFGRVKAMYDTLRPTHRHEQAGPSTPVNVTGLNVAPEAGDRFYVLDDISHARDLAEKRETQARTRSLAGGVQPHVTLETLKERLDQLGQEDEVQTLNLILRADVRGSIEAIRKELTKLEHPEVQIKVLQATVGGITEADVHLADASDAVIIGFNVVPDEGARTLAEQRGVQIRRYDIIYKVTEDLKAALEGMLRPEKREIELGRALVQALFHISRIGTVAGCRVLSGTIERNARVRVAREGRIIGDYPLDSLRREKDDVKEVREGMECGIKLAGFNDLKEGDILEVYKIEEFRRTI